MTVVLAWLMLAGGVIDSRSRMAAPAAFSSWESLCAAIARLQGCSSLRRSESSPAPGCYKKLRSAYWTAIAWQAVGVLNAVSLLIPSIAARATEVSDELSRLWMPQPPDSFIDPAQLASLQRHSITASGIFCALIFLFFLYAFYRSRSWYLGDSRTAVDGFAD